MSVTNNDRRYGIVNITGAAQALSVDFRIQDDSDALVLYYTASTTSWSATNKTLNTHYTISNKTSSGFTLTFGAAIGVNGDKALILDKRVLKTYASFTSGDPFPPETVQALFYDILVEYVQRESERIGRCLTLPPEETAKTTPDQTSTGTTLPVLPTAATEAQYLAWNPDTSAWEFGVPVDVTGTTITAYALTLLAAASAAAARALLGVADPALFLLLDGTTPMTGALDMDSHKINNVTDPTANQDAATKAYVDAASAVSDPFSTISLKDDFISVSATAISSGMANISSELGWTQNANAGGGGGSAVQSEPSFANSGNPGVLTLSTGTSTSGRAAIVTDAPSILLGGGVLTVEWLVRIEDLATAGEDYEIMVGLGDDATDKNPPNGVYFKYDRDTSANWYIFASDNNSDTSADSTVAVTADAWVRLKITINAAGTLATFYINGTSVGTLAALPVTNGRAVGPQMGIYKEAGTTARLMYVDLFRLVQTLTSAR